MKKILKIILLLIAIAFILVGGYYYFQYQSTHPQTDDAYVQNNAIYIAPKVNGTVDQVLVNNNQKVFKGQLLFTIDPKPFELDLQKAQASLQYNYQQVKILKAAVEAAKFKVAEAQA